MTNSEAQTRKEILADRNRRGWKSNGAIKPGLCLWASQELTARLGSVHEQPSAAAFYRTKKAAGQIHDKPRTGAIALWLGGSKGYGHAAVVLGHKHGVWHVLSTDILGAGSVRLVPIDKITSAWGQRLVGFWYPPHIR